MEWFKHQTGSHDDPDISDAWDELGDFGYVGFFVILEIYGQEYNHRNSEDFITISKTFLRRKLRKSWTKVELLLNFYSKINRIVSKSEGSKISIKVPKFIGLASNWTRRGPTEAPTEAPTAKEEEEKRSRKEVEKEKKKPLKEKNKKEKSEKYNSSFNKFWEVYPRRICKENALKAWLKLEPDEKLITDIINAINLQVKYKIIDLRENKKYCPHPATWLNQKRWHDEIEIEDPMMEIGGMKELIEWSEEQGVIK